MGHARAIDLVYGLVGGVSPPTEKNLFDLHKAVQTEQVMDVYKPLGAWKVEPNSTVIVSGNEQIIFEYASPKDVPKLMHHWFGFFQDVCREKGVSRKEALTAYVRLHVSFVRIHPFWDGNGRIARLIGNIPVISAGYPPIIIPKERRREYIEALSEYHVAAGTITGQSDLLPMVDKLDRFKLFCAESWGESIKLADHAMRKQQERNQR